MYSSVGSPDLQHILIACFFIDCFSSTCYISVLFSILSYYLPFFSLQEIPQNHVFLSHFIAKCRVANNTQSNGLNRIFVNKGNCVKWLRQRLFYLK